MSGSSAAATGRRLGRYHLAEPLGGGPTGEVFRAKVYGVAGFERQFAVKRFHAELVGEPDRAAQLAQAARLYGALEHPRIARMSEFGVAGGETFTATELVRGIDLGRLVEATFGAGKPLPAGAAAALLSAVARAIGFAHGRGLSHLGICPTNVLCTTEGDVKVTDFGFLPLRLPARPADDLSLGARLPYLAPEQHRGEAGTPATDVFQLGLLAGELLRGEPVLAGGSAADVERRAISGEPPALDVPKPLAQVVRRALARAPFERFPDAGAMADALDAAVRSAPLRGDRRDLAAVVRGALDQAAAMQESQLSGALRLPMPAPPPRIEDRPTTKAPALTVPRPGPKVPGPAFDKSLLDTRPGVADNSALAALSRREQTDTEQITIPGDSLERVGVQNAIETPLPREQPQAQLRTVPRAPAKGPVDKLTNDKPPAPGAGGAAIGRMAPPKHATVMITPAPKAAPRPPVPSTTQQGVAVVPTPAASPTGVARSAKGSPAPAVPSAAKEAAVSLGRTMVGHVPGNKNGSGAGTFEDEDSAIAALGHVDGPEPSMKKMIATFDPLERDEEAEFEAQLTAPKAKSPLEAITAEIPTPPAPLEDDELVSVPSQLARDSTGRAIPPLAAPPEKRPPLMQSMIPDGEDDGPTPLPPPMPAFSDGTQMTLEMTAPPTPAGALHRTGDLGPPMVLPPPMAVPSLSKAHLVPMMPQQEAVPSPAMAEMTAPVARPKRRTTRVLLLLLLLCAMGAGGYYGYLFYLDQQQAEEDGAVAEAPAKPRTPKEPAGATPTPAPAPAPTPAVVIDAGATGTPTPTPTPAAVVDAAPASASGELTITATPEGAQIYVDGAMAGRTSVTVPTGDKHRVAVILPGHKLHTADIEGRGDVSVTLEEITPQAGPGGIKVRCKVKDRYYVIIDGVDTGMLCPTERIGAGMGPHTVEIYDPVSDTRRAFNVTVDQRDRSHRVYVD